MTQRGANSDETGAYSVKLVQIWQEGQQVSQSLGHGSTYYGIAIRGHLLVDGQDEGCSHL